MIAATRRMTKRSAACHSFSSSLLSFSSRESNILCHNHSMPSRSSKDHDFATVARSTVEKFIGEKLSGKPLDDPNAGKNPAAVALGKLGGPKGGRARADKLSPARRKAIAKKAAAARWRVK